MNGHRLTIVAHRGLHRHFPENSAEAFAAAWQRGILWCECDVHLSKDGIPVVIHDETLDRTTNGYGNVAHHSAAELRRLGVPLLDEILSSMPVGCRLLVETKPKLGERIIPIARRVLETGGMLHSFNGGDIVIAQTNLGSALSCAFLADNFAEAPFFARRIHLDHKQITPDVARTCKAAGIALGAWTVNDILEKQRLAALGVDMIVTDSPI